MKDSKISLLLLLSLSMLLLAFAILFAWGFTHYKQGIAAKTASKIIIKDASTFTPAIKDSLQKIYTSSIRQLYKELDSTTKSSDVLQQEMDAKLREFVILKDEIAGILEKSATPAEIRNARIKLADLQIKVEDWRSRYNDVNEENKRLSQLLQQVSQAGGAVSGNAKAVIEKPIAVVMNRAPGNARIASNVPNSIKERDDRVKLADEEPNGLFNVTGMQLKAVGDADDSGRETMQDEQAEVIQGSFVVSNPKQSVKNAEIFIIVVQPDGKVLKQSAWESGMFETSQGRKVYSAKMRFDYSKAENKNVHFAITADRLLKGIYILQVYCNGNLIGRTSKNLS